ncbi:MAG: dTMP kinase [Mariprofundaceae bacterium]|nr:dTMP kinase [Mariprofundaceae bacterium]
MPSKACVCFRVIANTPGRSWLWQFRGEVINAQFITFEGGDGVGKTTQIKLTADYLIARGIDICCTREPGATDLGVEIRALLLSARFSPVPEAELFLFLADRAQHVSTCIVPALAAGRWVLCDRYSDSTLAYQLAARRLVTQNNRLQSMLDFAELGVKPDTTLWFDLPPQQALERLQQRSETPNRLDAESMAFHQGVYDGFLEIAKKTPRIHRIDATQGIKSIQQHIQNIIT